VQIALGVADGKATADPSLALRMTKMMVGAFVVPRSQKRDLGHPRLFVSHATES